MTLAHPGAARGTILLPYLLSVEVLGVIAPFLLLLQGFFYVHVAPSREVLFGFKHGVFYQRETVFR